MRPNQSRAILIFPITPTTTWLFAGYPYTTGTQKAAKISNKNSFFNWPWAHSLHRELMNASHSTNSFTNSCDHISTNAKAPLNSHINHNTPQFLYSLRRRANARYVNCCHITAGTHKFKGAVLVSGVPFMKSTLKKHEHILPCNSSGPCPKLLARVPKFRSAMLKMIDV